MQRKKYNFLYDILTDRNTNRYSMTKFGSLIGLLLFVVIVIVSLAIMVVNAEIDHVLIVEVIGFVLTLMGFKNNFGFSTNSSGNKRFKMSGNDSSQNNSDHDDFNQDNYNGGGRNIYRGGEQSQGNYGIEENNQESNSGSSQG